MLDVFVAGRLALFIRIRVRTPLTTGRSADDFEADVHQFLASKFDVPQEKSLAGGSSNSDGGSTF